MTLQPALAAPQTSLLHANSYSGETLVSLFSNRIVFAGQVNTDLSSGNWAQFNYNNVSVGAYTDVLDDEVLLISATNDITLATFRGRIRGVPSSSIITCTESSQNYSVGAYFWVVYSFQPQYKYSRPSTSVPATAVELVDYNKAFQRLLPAVVGIRSAYAGYVSTITGKLRLGFDMSQSYPVESGATISSYAYSFTGATLVAGSLSGAICIVDLAYGEQWAKAAVTDSGSRVLTRRIAIKVHDPTNYLPDTGFEGGSIENALDRGLTMSIPAFADVDSVLPNTAAIAWRNNETSGGVAGSLYGGGSAAVTNKALTSQTATLTATAHPFAVGQTVINADCGAGFDGTFVITATTTNTYSFHSVHANVASTGCSGMAVVNPNNVMFFGWLQTEDDPVNSDPVDGALSQANFKFTGIGPRLARLAAQLLALINSSSPALWGEMVGLTPWRAILHFLQRYTTIATLCDITFSDTTSAYTFAAISTQGGNALAVIQGIAAQINAVVKWTPDGRIAINREIAYLSSAERTAQTTAIAAWTATDALSLQRTIDPNPTTGYVSADGAFLNTANNQTTVLTAIAPGIAFGEAAGSSTLASQILSAGPDTAAAKTELQSRVGAKFKFDNLQEFLDVDHPDGYAAIPLLPSRTQTYTWTLDTTLAGSNGVNRIIYDTSVLWTIDSVSYQFNSALGTYTVKTKYRRVITTGDPGDDTTQNLPAPGEIAELNPDLGLPAFNWELPEIYFPDPGLAPSDVNPAMLLPPKGKIAAFNGQELITWSTASAFFLRSFIALAKPKANEVTPSDLGSYLIKQIVVDPFFTTNLIPAYPLASDGTNSAVWRTENIAAPVPTWAKGADTTGLYTIIRATKTAGTVLIYSPYAGSVTTQTFNFVAGQQGFAPALTADMAAIPVSVYTPAVGFTQVYDVESSGNTENRIYRILTGTFTGCTVTVSTNSTATLTVNDGSAQHITSVIQTFSVSSGAGQTFTVSTPFVLTEGLRFDLTHNGGSVTLTITSATLSGTGAVVTPSTDYGVTFGTTVQVGATPGLVGGFDVQRAGTVSYATAAGKVRKATTLGGAYSDWYAVPGSANPICIIIPYYRRNSATKNTSVSDPDVVIGCDNGKWYWINGTAATATTIDPVANLLPINENSITVLTGNRIAVIGSVSGAKRLYVSTNGGTSWTLAQTMTAPTFVRVRRNDSRLSPNGQLFVMDSNAYYSSKFASLGVFIRTLPAVCIGLETVW